MTSRRRRMFGQRLASLGLLLLASCVLQGAEPQASGGSSALVVEYVGANVTIVARSVSLRQVVTEWARLGHVRVVNPEHIPEAAVTVELRNVPEAAAVDVLLRGLPGYFLQQRPPDAAGRSVFDKLVVAGTPGPFSLAGEGARPAPGARRDERSDEAETDLWSPPPGMAPATGGAVGATPATPAAPPNRAIQPSMPGQTRPGAAAVIPPSKEPDGGSR